MLSHYCIVLPGVYCPPMSIHTWGITSSSATSYSWRDCSPRFPEPSFWIAPVITLICHNPSHNLANLLRHNFPHLHLVGASLCWDMEPEKGWLSPSHFGFGFSQHCPSQGDENMILVQKWREKACVGCSPWRGTCGRLAARAAVRSRAGWVPPGPTPPQPDQTGPRTWIGHHTSSFVPAYKPHTDQII